MTGKPLSDSYAVSPQIAPEDVADIASAGFTTVICNRPDGEVPIELQASTLAAAVEAAGMTFVDNPFSHSAFDMALVDAQDAAIAASAGPVFAYCASGNRSSVLWALGRARAGQLSPEDIVSAAAEAGYDLRGLMPQLSGFSA